MKACTPSNSMSKMAKGIFFRQTDGWINCKKGTQLLLFILLCRIHAFVIKFSQHLFRFFFHSHREFETSKQSRRKLQEEIDRLRRDNAAKTKQVICQIALGMVLWHSAFGFYDSDCHIP